MSKSSVLLLFLLAAAISSCNRSEGPPEPGQTVELWSRWEISFDNPDADPQTAEPMIEIRSPSQQGYRAVGFWDGGHTWRARFMPNETGVWYYRTPWPQPGEPEVGAFEVVASENKTDPFLNEGAVQVSSDGHYFEHASKKPFFWMADTAWNGALLASETDWARFLDDRFSKNFTAIQFVTTQWRTADGDAEGRQAYSGRDPIQINPEFYQRLDKYFDAVNEKGMLAVPVLLWALGDQETTPGKLGEVDAIQLARYQVARYGAHHVMWFLGGDGTYDAELENRWKRIGRAVFRDAPHAPVFLHPHGRYWPWEVYRNEEWLSALGYQSGHGDDNATLEWTHSGPPSKNWANPPARPAINLEPNYEDHISYQSKQPHSAFNVRRAAYWSLLNAPTAGVTYGGHGVWSWQAEAGVPKNHDRAGVAQPWRKAMALPGSVQMGHLSRFFQSLEWWKLRPAGDQLAIQPGTSDPAKFISLSVAGDGAFAVAYAPVGGVVALKPGSAAAGLTAAEWFDPRSGERKPLDTTGARFQAPDAEDWVLLLKRP